jgi:hypothetical protein
MSGLASSPVYFTEATFFLLIVFATRGPSSVPPVFTRPLWTWVNAGDCAANNDVHATISLSFTTRPPWRSTSR